MSALPSGNLDKTLLARWGVLQGTEALPSRAVLSLGWPELERALPDQGLPRGVVEIVAMPRLSGRPNAQSWLHGGATAIAIAALRSVHAAGASSWCAWITPQTEDIRRSLVPPVYAPALAQAQVDLARLLIVRPSPQALARTIVKVAASGAFGLVVVDAPHRQDLGSLPSPRLGGGMTRSKSSPSAAPPLGLRGSGAVLVRKLALAAEESGTTTLLLTSVSQPSAEAWPVALRLEVERRPEAIAVRVTKDRRGVGSSQHVVRLAS